MTGMSAHTLIPHATKELQGNAKIHGAYVFVSAIPYNEKQQNKNLKAGKRAAQ